MLKPTSAARAKPQICVNDPKGSREEVGQWMKRNHVRNIYAAAQKLGLSESTLKSMMSERGQIRYSEETLQRTLSKIREQGE